LNIKAPKGTRDFYPELMILQNHIFDIWKETCLAFGYEEYEAPIFEHLDLYTRKSGEEIVSQLYSFKDKGDRDLALRPEMTPTLARMINQKGPSLKLPVRWFSMPRLFRYERAQKGRLREFFQLNLDIIGCETISAETDLICAVIHMLKGFGLTSDDFSIGISNRKLLKGLLTGLNVPEDLFSRVYAIFDKKAKLPADALTKMFTDLSLPHDTMETLNQFSDFKSIEELENWEHANHIQDGISELKNLFQPLNDLGYGEFINLDLSIIRGLDYYTGIIFEVFDKHKSLRAIAGGGRYDDLMEHLGGKSLSGVGFGIGDVVLFELLKSKNLLPDNKQKIDYYLVTFGEIDLEVFQLAKYLREKGKRVCYSLNPEKFKKQLMAADRSGAEKVIFIGSDKVDPGKFEVKTLATGEQSVVSQEEL